MKLERLRDEFTTLAMLPGVSGQERVVAEYVKQRLDKLSWKTWFDDSGPKHDSDTGNLYALLEVAPGASTLMFAAHLDTVIKPGQTVKVVCDGETVASDGTTILGADDRSAVCALLLAAEALDSSTLKHNLLFFFSTREEAGVMGASFFAYPGKVRYIFNFDDSGPAGMFQIKAFGFIDFSIKITGRAAHAAQDYEHGKNAIIAAAKLVRLLPCGGDRKEGWTFNVGTIHGGSGTNVIPDEVSLRGEVRAYDAETLNALQRKVKEICLAVAKEQNLKIDYLPNEESLVPPFSLPINSDIIRICQEACHSIGLKAVLKTSRATSDANFLARFAPTVTVSRGGSKPHSVEETLKLTDLGQTIELIKVLTALDPTVTS